MQNRDIVVVAVSTGGLTALEVLLGDLPTALHASIFVAMHVDGYRSVLPTLLQSRTLWRVQHARDAEPFAPGVVYIAPPDRHLILQHDATVLTRGPKENFTRPAADPLFRSAAVHYGPRVVGIVLTGRLDDGAAGLKAVQACGGFAIVQDPGDSVARDMPANALAAVPTAMVLPLRQIGMAMAAAVNTAVTPRAPGAAPSEMLRTESRMTETGQSSAAVLERIGRPVGLTCPDCGGAIWRVDTGAPVRYRCHTGHAFSCASLHAVHAERVDKAIWSAARLLRERILLAGEEIAIGGGSAEATGRLRAAVSQWESAYQQLRSLAAMPDGPLGESGVE
ncbi:protein-glutamate methylesterase CheB [Achromobacter piechaudii ATCC 43553]|uniref:protein-glutamate methylesterase n=1 Tax=Achromobacter piechaudii ATCC 43553 TaxID=742159 RepID=D4XH23_9BURK|nr:protein-glutamate methylesterase CheB [Achromobacter piechaudii ATCC 43553]